MQIVLIAWRKLETKTILHKRREVVVLTLDIERDGNNSSINNKMDAALLVSVIMRIALDCKDSYDDIPAKVIKDLIRRLNE
jgi:hypothetical protein